MVNRLVGWRVVVVMVDMVVLVARGAFARPEPKRRVPRPWPKDPQSQGARQDSEGSGDIIVLVEVVVVECVFVGVVQAWLPQRNGIKPHDPEEVEITDEAGRVIVDGARRRGWLHCWKNHSVSGKPARR